MSAFVSIVHPYACHLFTDQAVWNGADQTLIDIRSKVTVSANRVAVITQGDAELGSEVSGEICARADALGPASVLTDLQSYADALRERLGDIEPPRGLHVLVTGMLPVLGGAHRHFFTYTARDRRAYQVINPDASVYWAGSRFKAEDIEKFGLGRRPTENDAAFNRRLGLDILNIMRFRAGRSQENGPLDIWCVGGNIDLTTIFASRAIVETHECWNDQIGEKIDPFRGMSRAERRRIERLVA